MQYAPIIIPTLNRYEHFKRCIESLEMCHGAGMTAVYIGLDFPPSDMYVDGWKKIDEYLLTKESTHKFFKLVVFRRDHNCGIIGPESNFNLLYKEALRDSDRLIASEDDNEFSPSFLEFMNKALEEYKDNPMVSSVCGYSHPSYNKASVKTSQIFVQDNCAWGFGIWRSKESCLERFDAEWCRSVLSSFSDVSKLMRRFPMLVSMMINMLKSETIYGDTRRTCVNILTGMLQVRPKVSLVRNWGNDGSGVNCKKVIDTSSEDLDMREHFALSDCVVARTKELDKEVYNILLPKYFCLKYLKICKIWGKFIVFSLCCNKRNQLTKI